MQIRIDIKSLIAGFLVGAVIFLVMGQAFSGSGDKADFGFAVQGNRALVKASDGTVFIVDTNQDRAETVVYREGPARGQPFNLNRTVYPLARPGQ